MHIIGRTIKYFLRSVFSVIIFLLFIGLAKMNRNTNAYISFLNSNNRSVFHWSQPATWVDPFWQNNQLSGSISDILSGDVIDPALSGMDPYDPQLEQDLNTFSNDSFSGTTEEDYGFTTTGQTPSDTETSSGTISKSELLDMIKANELAK